MNNTPAVRFKGFTEDWEQRKLSEMTAYRNGRGHEDKQSNSGKYELINLNSVAIDGMTMVTALTAKTVKNDNTVQINKSKFLFSITIIYP